MSEVLIGRLSTGIGQGRHFTRLNWAREQFMAKLGIDPFPGTVNVVVDDPDAMPVWVRLKRTPGIRIDNPNDGPHDCDARCYPVRIAATGRHPGPIDAAIVVPEVDGYPPAQVELIAPVGIRDAFALEDGDQLRIEIKPAAHPSPA
jgi:CTP-dependent riboflavin kinase